MRLYAKKRLMQHRLESRDLTQVIALSLYDGVNVSDFEQIIDCLDLVLFLFAANFQFLLCGILWRVSGDNMFNVTLVCGYSHHWLSSFFRL